MFKPMRVHQFISVVHINNGTYDSARLITLQRLIFLERFLLLISDDETLQIDTPCTFNKYNTLQ